MIVAWVAARMWQSRGGSVVPLVAKMSQYSIDRVVVEAVAAIESCGVAVDSMKSPDCTDRVEAVAIGIEVEVDSIVVELVVGHILDCNLAVGCSHYSFLGDSWAEAVGHSCWTGRATMLRGIPRLESRLDLLLSCCNRRCLLSWNSRPHLGIRCNRLLLCFLLVDFV